MSNVDLKPRGPKGRAGKMQPVAEPKRLHAATQAIHPRAVDGPFRRMKWAIMAACLALYYLAPWLRWDRGPGAPDQAVLIDLVNCRFYLFAIEIWPQEFYFVAGLLIMAGIGLFLLTTMVGRAWCGYACPQTVWTDLFQHVDRLIDGDRNAQMRLAAQPWDAGKIARRLAKWSIYLAISFATGGACILYFADAPRLWHEFFVGQASAIAYSTVLILTGTTLWLGGFMREQVCLYMCPWPRIQSAMLDERSLLVTYKDWRGEERGKTGGGDCVDCGLCAAVCPTGIDIRDGAQMACINCALCIDACDGVMARLGRPRGLIDYSTLEADEAGRKGLAASTTIWRGRSLAYLALWLAIGAGLLFALAMRPRLAISVAKDRNPPFMVMSDGSIRNAYLVKWRNMEGRPRPMRLSIAGARGMVMWSEDMDKTRASTSLERVIPADQSKALRVYVLSPAQTRTDSLQFRLNALDKQGGEAVYGARLDGPPL
ncbi:cytochrome c oxidase accessory protein FixG [Novosphingobium sp. SG751A]|nr:cytochrome c oxidase accessory protein FixG [Novosphingobium sp. SG751A]